MPSKNAINEPDNSFNSREIPLLAGNVLNYITAFVAGPTYLSVGQ